MSSHLQLPPGEVERVAVLPFAALPFEVPEHEDGHLWESFMGVRGFMFVSV